MVSITVIRNYSKGNSGIPTSPKQKEVLKVQRSCKRVALRATNTKGHMAMKLLLRSPRPTTRSHRCVARIHLEPLSLLLPPKR